MSRTVLVIEDNEQNAYLVKVIMEPHGYQLHFATDGASGLAMAEELVPDVILLDIQLPKMDGYMVARQLRSMAKLQHVPIIAVTSFAMLGDREKALAAGCCGHIEKPIDPETFVTEVEQAVRLGPASGGHLN